MERLAKYDVFLNHKGPDLKQTFVGHLYKALCKVGCNPFLDAKSLRKGQHAFKSIDEAFSGVRVHLAIFSPRYVESKYCLNELCDMLESKKLVIPVFYNVEPEDLRWPEREKGPFANACIKHRERGRDHDFDRWKSALTKAAAITGFRLAEFNNDTVKLEEKLVAAVLEVLHSCLPLPSARHLIGVREPTFHTIDMLERMGDNNVGVMGICGTGGIGKTTLAIEVYNREQSKFCSRCFLKDVNEFNVAGVKDLQMKMVSELLGVDPNKMNLDFAHWIERIQGQKVLLVIDDVNDRKQFDELIPCLKDLGGGSRVLITSRNRNILNDIMADLPEAQRAFYEVPKLNSKDSLDLFLWCSFRNHNIDAIDVAFHGFVEEISGACCGLPLALVVMGRFLSDKKSLPKDEKCWKQASASLQNNMDIITSLQMSYDGLSNDADKLMFIDIACLFLGYKETFAMVVWESDDRYDTPSVSLVRLIDKSLVKVDVGGHLSVHDLLRDMGRNIVKKNSLGKLSNQSHLWNSSMAAKVLEKKEGSNEILALTVADIKNGAACEGEHYTSMKEIRYLILDGCPVSGNFLEWSKELRWLQWRYFPHEELPSNLLLPNLADLDLSFSKSLRCIWPRNFEVECQRLELLILKNCSKLENLPTNINKLSNLKSLHTQGCKSLKYLPDSLDGLKQLELLNVSKCSNLKKLPDSFSELSNLKEVDISDCKLLQSLPPLNQLRKLKVLRINGTAMKTLPKDFGSLHNLVEFYAQESSLQELPDSFPELSNLKKMNISIWSLLQTLHFSIDKMKKSRMLHQNIKTLSTLLKDFGRLQNLVEFIAQGSTLQELPDSFSELSNLEKVDISDCKLLQSLPSSFPSGLISLRVLIMSGTTMKRLPKDFGRLHNLVEFIAVGAAIQELPHSFSDLSNLEKVDISDCKLLQSFPPSFKGLKKLKLFRMSGTTIKTLPKDFGSLHNLVKFIAQRSSLQELPNSFSELSNLDEVDISDCKIFQNFPSSLSGLKKLRVLDMKGTTMKTLPKDFGILHNLMKFHAQGSGLQELPDSFSELCNLDKVDISHCKLLQKLPPSLTKMKKLRVLRMNATTIKVLPKDFGSLHNTVEFVGVGAGLEKFPHSFPEVSNLEEVDISYCNLLQTLPLLSGLKKLRVWEMVGTTMKTLPKDFGTLHNLERFNARGSGLEELPNSFSKLSNLKEEDISCCTLLQIFPPLSGLKKLIVFCMSRTTMKTLPNDFGSLHNLVEINAARSNLEELPHSFSNLSNLEKVDISYCKMLHNLPPLTRMKNLRVLCMSGTTMETLPKDFGSLHNLVEFVAVGAGLQELPNSFSDLSNLEKLDISYCKLLQNLPPLKGLKKLKLLRMSVTTMKTLPKDFGRLHNLKQFCANDTQIEELPNSFLELSNIEKLDISHCKSLQSLSPISGLMMLRQLYMTGATIKILPKDFGRLLNLVEFNAQRSGLQELPNSFAKLSNLEKVDISHCKLL